MAKKRAVKWHLAPLGPGEQNAFVGRCRLIVYTKRGAGSYGYSIRSKDLRETYAGGGAATMPKAKSAAVRRARQICRR